MEHLKEAAWVKPGSYVGFSPDGDYCIATQHRESDALERSNYTCIKRDMEKAAAGFPDPDEEPLYDAFPGRDGAISPRSGGWVYTWSASHCLVGWVDYLMVRRDAPQSVLDLAEGVLRKLDGYPVYNEDHFSDLEREEVEEYWSQCSIRERINLIVDSGSDASIFAARRNWTPDDNGTVFNWIRD